MHVNREPGSGEGKDGFCDLDREGDDGPETCAPYDSADQFLMDDHRCWIVVQGSGGRRGNDGEVGTLEVF